MKRLAFAFLLALMGCQQPAPTAQQTAAPTPAPTSAVEPLVHLTELATVPSDKRIAILLHGYGSNEHDLIPLARRAGFKGIIESYVAPEQAGNGYAWFPINFEPGGTRYAPDAADEVLLRLAESLRELRQTHTDGEFVVLGFSQGAMMTMLLAAEHPDALDRGIALSGALPRPPRAASGEHPPLFMAHGTNDRVVPVERGRAAHEALRGSGISVTFREYAGLGHSVSPAVLRDVQSWAAASR